MQKIIVKYKDGTTIIVLVEKHKIKEIIGFINKTNELILDFNLLIKNLKNGCKISKTALDLIYKRLSKYIKTE